MTLQIKLLIGAAAILGIAFLRAGAKQVQIANTQAANANARSSTEDVSATLASLQAAANAAEAKNNAHPGSIYGVGPYYQEAIDAEQAVADYRAAHANELATTAQGKADATAQTVLHNVFGAL